MATAIEVNRPPKASFCCCGHAGELERRRRPGSAPSATSASIVCRTAIETAPVSSLVISAVIDADGRLVDPGDAALDVGLLDGRDVARAAPWPPCRPAARCRSSTEVVDSGSSWTTRSTGWPSSNDDLGDGLRDERGADLAGHLCRGRADGERLVRIDRDLDLGRGLDQVALEVGEVGVACRAPSTTVAVVDSTRAGSSLLTMMFRPFEVKPAACVTWTS